MSQKDTDERFSKIYSDPRFRTLRKKDKALKVDSRFKNMFTEDKFTLKYSMDKRGKSRKHLIAEDYKKFYRLSDEEESNDQQEDKVIDFNNDEGKIIDKDNVEEKIIDKDNVEEKIIDKDNVDEEDSESGDSDEEEENTCVDQEENGSSINLTHQFGYHRGLKIQDSDDDSSSSSSDSEESEAEEEELEHDWGEVDKDAPRTEDVTSRVAICNVDWDRINAQDLYVLLSSFKTAIGAINSVRIYYSKFGEERLTIEEQKGPAQFIFGKASCIDTLEVDNQESNQYVIDDQKSTDDQEEENQDNADSDEEVKDTKTVEKLRKYQLERLKYFYAVVECDSDATAQTIYNELDGMEYESSSSTLDLRFIPDEMTFDDVKLKEECTSMPKSNNYTAPSFINTALQQSNVRLTWDEDDDRRKKALDKAFEENNDDDLKIYLASSSEDDDYGNSDVEVNDNLNDLDKINKYKDLLKSLDENIDDDIEMEVTWDPGLKANAEDLIKNKNKKNLNDSQEEPVDDSEIDEETINEEVVEDFVDDLSEEEARKAAKKKSKDKYKKWKKNKNVPSTENPDNGNLELLMMDMDQSGEKRKHFNYKEIVENYSKNSENTKQDDFEFNDEDDRFKAIYTSHLYNIDQSDPNFKKTKAFDKILSKRKHKASQLVQDEKSFIDKPEVKRETKSWNVLVNKVKDKANATISQTKLNSIDGNSKFNVNKRFKR